MLIFLFSLFGVVSSLAAEGSPGTATETEPVILNEVVSNGKRLESDRRGVVVFTEGALAREGGRTLGEVLRETAGVDYTSGTGGNSNLLIRGSSGSQILVLIDGVKANDPSATNRYFDWSRIDISQVSRIEILKGPQAVSYGSDALGGVVIIQTKRGETGLRASVEAGSEAFARSRVSYGESLGPAHSFSLYALGKGIFSGRSLALGATPTTPRNSLEGDDSKEASVGGEFRSQLSDSLVLRFTGDLRAAEEEIDGGPFDDDPNYVARNREIRGAVLIEGPSFRGLLSHLDFRRAYVDFPDSAHTFGPYNFSDSVYRGQNTRMEWESHSPRRAGKSSVEWSGGVEGTRETLGVDSLAAPVTLGKDHAEMVALFGEGSVPISSWGTTRADFGSRFSHFTSFGNQWSGKAGLTTAVGTDLTLDAGVSTGFKAPSLFSLYDPVSGNTDLKPEDSVQGELGGVYSFTRVTSLELRGYATRVSNRFGYQSVAPYRSLNIERAEIKGIEVALDTRVTPETRFVSTTSYTDSKDLATGRELPDVSKWKQTFKFEYSPSKITSVSLSFLAKNTRGASASTTFVAGYGRFDLAATHSLSERFSFYGRIENLLDRDYQEIRGYSAPGISGFVGAEFRGI